MSLTKYEKAIALDPKDAVSDNNKGIIEEKLGYLQRFKESFKRADKLAGHDTAVESNRVDKKQKVVRPLLV